jgi:membrane protein implicated in regulation of membrane protease activity
MRVIHFVLFMVEWFEALALEKQLFYVIGMLALLVLGVQVVLLLLGVGGDAMDFGGVDADGFGGHDHPSGLGMFSINTITAFFLGFGWIGAWAMEQGWGLPVAVIAAGFSGAVLMFGTYGLLLGLTRLQSDGTRKYDSALGTIATVYSTVPGGGNTSGQIEVMIGGRLTTAGARHRGPENLPPGARVKISAMDGATSYLVEPLSAEPTEKPQEPEPGPGS